MTQLWGRYHVPQNVFLVRFCNLVKNELRLWLYELHSPHLLSVRTLPCQSWTTKNVIFQRILPNKLPSNVSKLYRNGPGSCALNLLIWGVIQQCVYETKIHDIDDLRKHLMQTCFNFEQDMIDAAIDQWRDRLRSRVHAGGRHIVYMLWNECSFMIYVIHENILSNCHRYLIHLTAIL